MTPSVTESQVFQVTGGFLAAVTSLPSGQILQGQQNLVPPPSPADYIVMWPIGRARLATNVDNGWQGETAPTSLVTLASTRMTVQCDVHGPNSGDNVQVISTAFRSDYAVAQFIALGFACVPLYASDPMQMPFIDGEAQYEQRWTVDLAMDIEPTIALPMQFADELVATLVEVDAIGA